MPTKRDYPFLLYACNHHWIDESIDVRGYIDCSANRFRESICLPISKNCLVTQLKHDVKSALSPALSGVLTCGVVRNAL